MKVSNISLRYGRIQIEEIQIEEYFSFFLNMMCLLKFWCFFFFLFSPSNSLFRELIYKEMLPVCPRIGGGSTTVRRVLFYDLSWSRQAVTGRSTQSSELHNYPPAWGPRRHRSGELWH